MNIFLGLAILFFFIIGLIGSIIALEMYNRDDIPPERVYPNYVDSFDFENSSRDPYMSSDTMKHFEMIHEYLFLEEPTEGNLHRIIGNELNIKGVDRLDLMDAFKRFYYHGKY